MLRADGGRANRRIARLRTGLIAATVVAVVLGVMAGSFFVDLERIGPCNGGLGLPWEVYNCPTTPPEFLAEQLGHSQIVNGTSLCSVIIYPQGVAIPYSTAITVWLQTLSGARENLLSVALYATAGSLLANFSSSGTNWTTSHSIAIVEPDILNVTASTDLIGHELVISDHVAGFAMFLPIH